jgi:hypothetical protein
MRAGRRASAAIAALALAVVPGALRLVPTGHVVDRAAPTALGAGDAHDGEPAPISAPAPVAEAPPPVASAPPTPAPSGDVPITPPAELRGDLAPMVAMAAPFAQAQSVSGTGEVYALVVGIDDYPGDGYDLRAAVADADTVEQALAHFGVPAANRVVLRNGQARHAQVVGAVQALVRQAGPGSTVVLGYAGHVRKLDRDTEAILTADGRMITDQELADLLAPSRADNMWVLLASCYAGGFTELLAPGRILTGAADAGSVAYESPSLHGSYLVHHMVREGWLEGKAGPSIQEAFAYADARIRSTHPDRRPVQLDQAGGRLRLGPGTSGPADPGPTPSSSPAAPTTTEPPRRCSLVIFCRRS